MSKGILFTGIPSAEELKGCRGIPGEERMARGPVAHIECVSCIPCNPCESACPRGAITVGAPMTNAPVLDEAVCIGCGDCIAKCPGLAITVIDRARGGGRARLDFPFEYLPLPKAGDTVRAVDRAGEPVCEAVVCSVRKREADRDSSVVGIEFPLKYADRVKSIKRLKTEG